MNELDPVHIDDSHPCIPCFERLRQENLEQARLLGISGSHEAKLLAENERLQSAVDLLVHDQRKRIESLDKLYTENESLKADLAERNKLEACLKVNEERDQLREELEESHKNTDHWQHEANALGLDRNAWKARSEKLAESLMLVLPMVKGYVAEYPNGSNQSICNKADDVVAAYAKATDVEGK